MAILVPHFTTAYDSGTLASQTITLPTTTTGNDLIVIIEPGNDLTDITTIVNSVSISPGSGSFSQKYTTPANSTVAGIAIWAAHNIVGGTTPVLTVNWTNPTVAAMVIGVIEASGLNGSTDGSTGAGSTNTAMSSGSIVTTNANDLLVGATNNNATVTAGESLWTADFSTGNLFQYSIVSSTGTYASTGTQNSSALYTAIIGAFQGTGAGGTIYPASGNPGASLATASSSVRRILTPVLKRF